jgi:hypothetical protein
MWCLVWGYRYTAIEIRWKLVHGWTCLGKSRGDARRGRGRAGEAAGLQTPTCRYTSGVLPDPQAYRCRVPAQMDLSLHFSARRADEEPNHGDLKGTVF